MANLGVTATTTDVPTTAATTETVMATSPIRDYGNPEGQGVRVSGVVNFTAGTGTTAVTVRVRRGTSITGTLIGEAQVHTLAAAATANLTYDQLDSATLTADDVQYVVTVQQTGASANGTGNSSTITTEPATSAA